MKIEYTPPPTIEEFTLDTGVYEIVCAPTGLRYVGSSGWSLKKRWAKHVRDLSAGKHHAPRLQYSWRKYGPSAFEFRIIERCPAEAAVEREQFWLDALKPEFNTAKQAYSCKGVRRTPAQRERYAAAARRRHAEGRGATQGLAKYVKTEKHREWARQHAINNQPRATAARRRAT